MGSGRRGSVQDGKPRRPAPPTETSSVCLLCSCLERTGGGALYKTPLGLHGVWGRCCLPNRQPFAPNSPLFGANSPLFVANRYKNQPLCPKKNTRYEDRLYTYCCTRYYQYVIKTAQFSRGRLALTPSGPESRFGDRALNLQGVYPQNGTAVRKGSTQLGCEIEKILETYFSCSDSSRYDYGYPDIYHISIYQVSMYRFFLPHTISNSTINSNTTRIPQQVSHERRALHVGDILKVESVGAAPPRHLHRVDVLSVTWCILVKFGKKKRNDTSNFRYFGISKISVRHQTRSI